MSRYSSDPAGIGSKLAPKLVQVISDTIVATKRKLLDTEHRARVHSMQEIIDRAGREVADLYRPVWEATLKETDMPGHVRDHIEKMMSGRHQWQALAGLGLISGGAGNALSQILSNYLADSVRSVIAKDPLLAPEPGVLAQLGAKGALDWNDVYYLSAGQGFSQQMTTSLRIASYSWPDLTTILELLRRNKINIIDARFLMTRSGINPEIQPWLENLQEQLLSPADLADMVVRGIKTEAEAATLAAESGVSDADFHAMVLDNGEPLALMQLLEAYRRRFIDQGRLAHGIRQSRIRDEWIDVAEKLRFSPMSVADAVNAVVQNHLSAAQGEAIAQENGLEPGAFATLQATAGEPLSRTEMSELVNRGEATEADFVQAMRESRVKDKYIPYAFALRRRIIPARMVAEALRNGAIDHATAVRIIMDQGYTKQDADVMIGAGSAQRTNPYKTRVVSAIETLYEDGVISESEASDLITGLGFDKSQAGFVVRAAGYRKTAREVAQETGVIRTRYAGRRITRAEASNDLDAMGIVHTHRDELLRAWDIERDANVRTLTEAQIVSLVKKQVLTPEQGLTRLENLGYSADDAGLLLEGI